MKPSAFRLLSIVVFATGACATRAQITVSDDFNVAHNYLSGSTSGTIWTGALNAGGGTTVAQASGALTITSASTGWEWTNNSGFFLYIEVPSTADFVARVQVTNASASIYNVGALLARAPSPLSTPGNAEDWVAAMYSAWTPTQPNDLRSTIDGVGTQQEDTFEALPYLELAKTGDTFIYSASNSGYDSMTSLYSIVRPDLGSLNPYGTLQIGIEQGGFSGISNTMEFDNFSLTTSAIPEPSSYALFGGVAALGFVLFRRQRDRRRSKRAASLH